MATPTRLLFCLSSTAVVVVALYDTRMLVNLSSTLIKYYRSSCVKVIHKNNLTDREEEQVFQVFKALTTTGETVGVYSFRTFRQYANDIRYQRQNCLKPIKYVIGEDDSREDFSEMTLTTPMGNDFWLIMLNSSTTRFLIGARTPFNTELVVARFRSHDLVDLREVYRVAEDFPLRKNPLGVWTSDGGLELDESHLYARRFDLEGKLLRTGSIENWPLSTFKDGIWDGYFPRIWRELEKLINCTTKPFRSVDNSTGVLKSNGSWNGLVGMIWRGEIDVIVSETTMNDERSAVLKFSRPVLISNYQVFFCALGSNLKWSAVLQPFSPGTWLAVSAWVAAGTLALTLCYYLLNRDDDFTPFVSFFFVVQSLCQQGYPTIPHHLCRRIIFLSSYLLSAVLIPSYSAWLIYSLTHHTPNKPFNSFEEFLSTGRYELNVIRNSAQQTYFKRSTNDLHRLVYAKVRRNKHRVLTLKEGLEKSLCVPEPQAFFGVEAIVRMHLEHSPMQSCCDIVTFAKPLSPVHQSLAFLKGSPYGELINYKLHRLFTTGIIDNIQEFYEYKRHAVTHYKNVEVAITDVFQIFVLLFIGVILSVVLCLVERSFRDKFDTRPDPGQIDAREMKHLEKMLMKLDDGRRSRLLMNQ